MKSLLLFAALVVIGAVAVGCGSDATADKTPEQSNPSTTPAGATKPEAQKTAAQGSPVSQGDLTK